MNEGIPRSLLTLTAIVALAAVSVGIKDYFQKMKEAQPTASVAPSKAASGPKNASSAKLRRVRMSALAADAANIAHSAEDTEKPFISQQSSEADAKALIVKDHAPNTRGAQAAHDQADATDRGTRLGNELKTNVVGSAFSVPRCMPLPNSVMQGDVDAPYYENWAQEYSCQLQQMRRRNRPHE
jgi:hypothetical protein